jgi:hypothetical protein
MRSVREPRFLFLSRRVRQVKGCRSIGVARFAVNSGAGGSKWAAPNYLRARSRRKALANLLSERWEYTMRTNPIYATVVGDKRFNDQLGDFSEEAVEKDLQEARKFLARFEAIEQQAGATFLAREARPCQFRTRLARRCRRVAKCATRYYRHWRRPP